MGEKTKGMGLLPVLQVTEEGRSDVEDVVAEEFPLTIILNNQELVTLLCTPVNLEYLVIGFLFSEGLLESRQDLKSIAVDKEKGVARVETIKKPPEEALPKRVEAQIKILPDEVFALMEEFQHRSQIFRTTGGVHAAALCNRRDILVFAEDIGRHNAIDKILGECILNDIPTDNRIIITSGRTSSEILLKADRRNIPVIVSISAPTDLAVRLADDLGITLIGFARGKRMNVYSHSWRIKS